MNTQLWHSYIIKFSNFLFPHDLISAFLQNVIQQLKNLNNNWERENFKSWRKKVNWMEEIYELFTQVCSAEIARYNKISYKNRVKWNWMKFVKIRDIIIIQIGRKWMIISKETFYENSSLFTFTYLYFYLMSHFIQLILIFHLSFFLKKTTNACRTLSEQIH